MPEFEARWPCPVCPSINLAKVRPGGGPQLDVCDRCGGVWFDAGEVPRLAEIDPGVFWASVIPRGEVLSATCPQCETLIPRNLDRCEACGRELVFKCPCCQEPMAKVQAGESRLDVCKRCKGVWFDHHELEAVWKRTFGTVLQPRRGATPGGESWAGSGAPGVAAGVGDALVQAALWDPGLVIFGAHAAGEVVAGVAQVAPGLIAGAVEVGGSLAAAAFEAIVEIISGLLSG